MEEIKKDNAVQKSASTIKRDFVKKTHTKVAGKLKNRKLMVGVMGGIVMVLIMYFMIFGGPGNSNNDHAQSQPGLVKNNGEVLNQNEQKLQDSQSQTEQQVDQSASDSGNDQNAEAASKEQAVRLNAPTTIYSGSQQGNEAAGKSKNNTLAAGNGYASFANSQNDSVATVSASKIAHPNYTIAEGEFIHATLETAINSDLPGMVRAVVADPVYSYSGDQPMVPAGSRLIGQYASIAGNGPATGRVFIIWNRIVTPSGLSIVINSPGSDSLGQGGQGADAINSHFGQIFGNAFLLSIIGAGTANYNVNSTDQPNSADAYRQALASSLQQTAGEVLGRNMSITPTLHIHQGAEINVFVSKDLDLYGVLAGGH